MKIIITREDYEILSRLTDCLMKTFTELQSRFPDSEELEELDTFISDFFRDFCNLKRTNLNLNVPFNNYYSNRINELLNTVENLSDKLNIFIETYNISKIFRKYLKFKNYSMIKRKRDRLFLRLVI